MESEPVLSESTKRRRAKKEGQKLPEAVLQLYAILKEFDFEDRRRLIDGVEVLLRDKEPAHAK